MKLQTKRPRARDGQWTAERAGTATTDGGSDSLDTTPAESPRGSAAPNALLDPGADGDLTPEASAEAPEQGADESRGHRFSNIAVFPREHTSANGFDDQQSADIERASDVGDSTRAPTSTGIEPGSSSSDSESGLRVRTPSRDSESGPRVRTSSQDSESGLRVGSELRVRTLEGQPAETPRAHRFSDVAVFPREDTLANRANDPVPPDLEHASPHDRATLEPAGTKVDPETDLARAASPAEEEVSDRIDTVEEKPEVEPIEAIDKTRTGSEDVDVRSVERVLTGVTEDAEEGGAEADGRVATGEGRGGGAGQPARAGGQGRGGGAGGGEAAGAGGESASLNDAALDQWQSATAAATEAVPAPELPEGQAAAAGVGEAATAIANERAQAQADYESEAKDAQEPVPEAADKESQLDTSEAEQAVADVKALADRRLSAATFSPTGSPPPYPGLNPRDFVPANDLRVLQDIENRLAGTNLSAAERVSLTNQLERVQAHIAGIEERAMNGTAAAAPPTAVDEGASSLEPPPADQAAVLGDAIARAITTIPGRGRALAVSAARPLDQGRSPELQELAAGKADTVESEMREELDQIAAAAGISVEQLTGKIAEQKEAAAALAAEQDQATETAADRGVEARSQQGVEEQGQISGAKQAVEKEIAATESAVDGPPDTEAIEAKRDEFLDKLERSGSEVLASYRSSLEKRTGELNEAAGKQKGNIHSAADGQAAAIRRHFAEDPEKGAVESLPTKNWATTAGQQVDAEAGRFSQQATTENKGFVDSLNDQLSTARDTVRDWAAHQEGRERSWWEQLIDMIRDWGKQAVANNEAWERQRAADSRDAMAGDLDALAQLRRAQLSRNGEELNAAVAGLDAEQQALAVRYLRGQGVDSIGFVAESTMLRIVRRRRGELTDSLREEVIRDWDWEQLGTLARANNPEFLPKNIAAKVKGSIAGVGTSEDKLYAALGTARGPFERAAVEKCYQATYGISMAEDVHDDVEDTEWDRAEALMQGGTADVAVATIADAIAGAGTDEAAIKEALRGKTPAELEEIKRLYKERYGVELKTDLAGDMEGAELENALALSDGDTSRADAAELEDAMEGAGTDEEKITQVYEKIRKEVEADARRRGLSVAEMRAEIERRNTAVSDAYAARYGRSLRSEFADEMSGGELTLANALDSGDPSRIDAAKAKVEDEAIVYSSDDRLEDIVRNQHTRAELEAKLDLESQRARAAERLRSGDINQGEYEAAIGLYEQGKEHLAEDVAQRATQNMRDLKGEYGTMAVGGDAAFDVMIQIRTTGYSTEEITKLIANGGQLSPEDEIYYAVAGAGTNEDMIKRTLAGKTPEQIDEIRRAYEAKHGEGSFNDDILGDLSGREDLDTGLILEIGDPSTFTAQLLAETDPAKRAALRAKMERYLEERKRFEQTGSIGSSMLATGTDQMNTEDQMADAIEAARKLDAAITAAGGDLTDPAVVNAQHRMDMNFMGAVEAQEQFREQIDAYADIAVQVGAAIAGIAVTVATFGAGAPLAVAAMWGAAASAATGMYMNADLRGAAYSWEEAGVDAAVGVVDVAAAGLGAKYLGPLVKQAGMLEIVAAGLADGLEGVPSALLEAGMDEAIWASGDPGGALLKTGGMALGTGAAMSMGFDVLGGAYGMVTGPKVKPGGPSIDVDVSPHGTGADVDLSPHGTGADVDLAPGGSPHHGADVDAPAGRMPELDVPPVADPDLAARRAGQGELPPGAPDHAPRSPNDADPTIDTGDAARVPGAEGAEARQPHVGEDGIIDLDDPRNRWMVEDAMAGHLPNELAADPVASRQFFEGFVRSQPEIEAGLLRNSETGEHIVVQGSPRSVDIRSGHGAWEELIPADKLGRGRWDLVVHSHPVDASGVTPGSGRVPSGASGDFAWTVYQAQASGRAVVQEIHVTTEAGADVTRYGYDPTSAEPYSIDFPRPDGPREVKTFATIDDYHRFYNERFGGDLGPVPDDFPGVKQADRANPPARVEDPASDLDGFDDEPTVEIPVRPEAPTTVPSTPASPAGDVAAGGMAADLTTGRPGMAKLVADNAELATRLDTAVAALDAAAGGLSDADRAAVSALFSPTNAEGGMGVGRFEQRIGVLERAVELVGERPSLLKADGQRQQLKVLQHEGQLVLDAFDAGATHEQAGRPVRPSAELQAEMDHLRALLADPPELGTDAIDGLLRLEQLQQDISRASEILRSNGDSLWQIHSPDQPFPSVTDAAEVREAIDAAGGVGSMTPAAVLSATEVMDLEVSASGTLGEPLARNLPGVGLEGYVLTPRAIGELLTDPPGLGQRLAQLLAGYHRAHMVGPGFGDELFAGIMLAPANFNLDAQNKGVEALLRALRARGEDVQVSIHATGTRHAIPMAKGGVEHVDILQTIRYEIRRPGSLEPLVIEYRIGAPPGGAVSIGRNDIPQLTVDGLPEPPAD